MPRPRRDVLANKLPPDYVQRTLARLLPVADELDRLDLPQLEALLAKKEELEHLIKVEPLRFFNPNPGAQEAFLRCWDTESAVQVLMFFAGNKTGKSTGGGILFGERLLGKPLWGEDRPINPTQRPTRGVIFAEDFESHEETIMPILRSWWPRGVITNIRRNNLGNIQLTTLANGSVIHHKTYAQGSDAAEGKDWDICWCDEPPPQSLYTAIMRGLVSTNGRLIITATLLKEVWLYDERDKPFVRAFQASIHDNQWLNKAAKEAFLDSLPDDERQVRELGNPMSLTGLIYKHFQDAPPYVVSLDNLPTDCPYIVGIDPHERRPVYVEWGFITPQDEIVWFDWDLIRGDTETIFARMAEKEAQHPCKPIICIMDPNRGRARQINSTSWEEVFIDAGYDVLLGEDDMNYGHTAMYNYLKVNPATGRPKMVWTEDCRGRLGPIFQMCRYSWDEYVLGSRIQREQKEKPRELYKDFPDIHRYTAMANLSYDQLSKGAEVFSTLPKNWQGYGRVERAVNG